MGIIDNLNSPIKIGPVELVAVQKSCHPLIDDSFRRSEMAREFLVCQNTFEMSIE